MEKLPSLLTIRTFSSLTVNSCYVLAMNNLCYVMLYFLFIVITKISFFFNFFIRFGINQDCVRIFVELCATKKF